MKMKALKTTELERVRSSSLSTSCCLRPCRTGTCTQRSVRKVHCSVCGQKEGSSQAVALHGVAAAADVVTVRAQVRAARGAYKSPLHCDCVKLPV